MAITLELKPDVEARLYGMRSSVVCSSANTSKPTPERDDADAWLNRVRNVLKKFDELPRLAQPLDMDQVIGYDQWGLPER
jgi:hypothetical protein